MIRRAILTALAVSAIGAGWLAAQAAPGTNGQQMAMPMAGMTPKVGDMAPAFSLSSLTGGTVTLADALKDGPVVLLMMRGWPGYQCPFCSRQFGEYLRNEETFKTAAGRVIFVYPGSSDGLMDHAKAFTADRELPSNFSFLIDPDYTFTNAYGLRWEAQGETAYPSTFVLDRTGKVTFAYTSRAHGDRVPVADVLKALSMIGG